VRVDQRLVTEVVAVRERVEDRLVAVAAGTDLLHLAMCDEECLVGLVPEFDDGVPGGEFPLLEPGRERGEHVGVGKAAEQRQFAEFGRNHPNRAAVVGERDPAVADRVGQAAVDPVRAAGNLHPRQHLQQPPRRDALHLGDGLLRRGQVPSRGRRQALPRPLAVRADPWRHRFRHRHNAHHQSPKLLWTRRITAICEIRETNSTI
jgi:hypothetical protein